jgi:hypothetical protein
MVFAEAVGFVESALAPGNVELPLLHPVTHPAQAHAHSLRSFLLGGVIGSTGGCTVASLNRSRGLWMSRFLERCSD